MRGDPRAKPWDSDYGDYGLWGIVRNRITNRIETKIKLKASSLNDLLNKSLSISNIKDREEKMEFSKNNKITEKEKEYFEKKYGPSFDEEDRVNDEFMKSIIFGLKQGIPLIQYCNDSWYRLVVETKTNITFNTFQNILKDKKMIKQMINTKKSLDLCQRLGVTQYGKSASIKIKINDDMEIFYIYIVKISEGIKLISKNNSFQFDLSIIPKNDHDIKKNEKEEKKELKDDVSTINIENELNENNLTFYKFPIKNPKEFTSNEFRKIFIKFINLLRGILMDSSIPNQCRICCVIDRRREKTKFDELYFYVPCKDNFRFKNNLSLSYITRSTHSLFNNNKKLFSLFTSFHVISMDNIKVYQYWNRDKNIKIGGRFSIFDVKAVWKNWFADSTFCNKLTLDELEKCEFPDNQFNLWYLDETDKFRKCGYNLIKFEK